ncbi:MAG: hypothetical protein O7D29_09465 [Gemmatimonadetes bacterium]|nr:hypothetical protein [Gemmatimonadota bacterium]
MVEWVGPPEACTSSSKTARSDPAADLGSESCGSERTIVGKPPQVRIVQDWYKEFRDRE